jgi:hypothetical protein
MKELVTMSTDAVAEKRLLAAVVARAISDCCIKPSKGVQKLEHAKMNANAFTAMRFIFDTTQSGLDAYAQWLDFTPEVFREKILQFSWDVSPGKKDFLNEQDRKNFRHNYFLYRKMTKSQKEAMTAETFDDTEEA